MTDEVLVIGAGPAGLTSAWTLERAGIPYRVVDRADKVGSTWASLYPSLRLNTANFVSNLPGTRVSWRHGFYMTGRNFYDHLARFAEKHRFNIDLGVEVFRVAPEGGGWRVETSEGTVWYPAVILATGRFSTPVMPSIPGMETFSGRIIHARDFRDPADFAGARALIVGNGPSGADIAIALSEATPHPVLLSIRSDILIARRYPFGLPEQVWKIVLGWLPEPLFRRIHGKISYQGYRGIEKYGLKTAPNREDRAGTSAPIRGPELLRAMDAGRVKPVAGLARLSGPCAYLMDGSEYPVDLVIMATGYRATVDFLDIDVERDKDGWPVRAEGQEVAGYPGLYIVGRFYQGLGPLWNMKEEARIAVGQIAERLNNLSRSGVGSERQT